MIEEKIKDTKEIMDVLYKIGIGSFIEGDEYNLLLGSEDPDIQGFVKIYGSEIKQVPKCVVRAQPAMFSQAARTILLLGTTTDHTNDTVVLNGINDMSNKNARARM